jgi:type I restriction enzyme S subunit
MCGHTQSQILVCRKGNGQVVPIAVFVTQSTGFMRLYTDRFGTIKLPVPPKAEQSLIVQGISVETREIELTQERINREISLFREYRARLIADLVTGKLDVREAAAQLPEEVPEVEPLDEMEDMPEDEGVTDDEELAAAIRQLNYPCHRRNL